jgi:Flp pilus assembly protein TadD
VAVLSCLLVCGWHYARVWRHFGKPLVGAWEPISGFQWWQDAGYRTGAYFFGVGKSLVAPLFSGHFSFADGIFSTMWGDAYCGGLYLDYRPPWNYQLMVAGYVLGLFPTVLILAGTLISLARFIRKPEPTGLLLNGLAWSFITAFVYMALKVPCYSQIKAFYGLLVLLPVCVFAAEGWDFFTRRSKLLWSVSGVALGLWGLSSFSTYWISQNSAQPHFLLGSELALARQHEKAVREFSAALESNPGHLLARSMLVDSLTSLGQEGAANRALGELSERHPHSVLCELDRAKNLEKEGRLEEAVEHTRLAIAAAPELVVGYRFLASRYARLGRPEEVIAACRDGLGIAPTDWELHTLLGRTLAQSARPSGLTSNPAPAESNHIFAPSDPIEEAVRHLRLATKLSSEAIGALDKLAWIRATAPEARWRNGDDAVALAERACQLTGYHVPDLLETLAAAYAEAGRFAEAVTTVEKARTLAEALGQKQMFKRHQEWVALFGSHRPYRD